MLPTPSGERRPPAWDLAFEEVGTGRPTTRWSRPGQPEVTFNAILALAGRAAHLEAVSQLERSPLAAIASRRPMMRRAP